MTNLHRFVHTWKVRSVNLEPELTFLLSYRSLAQELVSGLHPQLIPSPLNFLFLTVSHGRLGDPRGRISFKQPVVPEGVVGVAGGHHADGRRRGDRRRCKEWAFVHGRRNVWCAEVGGKCSPDCTLVKVLW